MTGERPVDLALLLTSIFAAVVWEEDVEVDLYSFDLMHMDPISKWTLAKRLTSSLVEDTLPEDRVIAHLAEPSGDIREPG